MRQLEWTINTLEALLDNERHMPESLHHGHGRALLNAIFYLRNHVEAERRMNDDIVPF